MDGLDLHWQVTPSLDAAKALETEELAGGYRFPLNIQGNKHAALKPFIRYLKQRRKEYKECHLVPRADQPKSPKQSRLKITAPPVFHSRAKRPSEGSEQIYLVSCVGKKLASAAPAKDLYTSAWFKKARCFVENQGAEWFVLSAKHGLISPEQKIEPYERTLNRMKKKEREQWAYSVFNQLQNHVTPSHAVTFLAGRRYREFLEVWLRHNAIDVDVPMVGLGIGKQLKWLGDAITQERGAEAVERIKERTIDTGIIR